MSAFFKASQWWLGSVAGVADEARYHPLAVRKGASSCLGHSQYRHLSWYQRQGLLFLAPPAFELGSMQVELLGNLADTYSLDQSQRFVLVGLGVAGAGLFHQRCWSCHDSLRAVYRLTGCPLGLGKIGHPLVAADSRDKE